MAKLPDVQVIQSIVYHEPCNFPVRVVARYSGFGIKLGKDLADVRITYAYRSFRTYTFDADDRRITFCPICGQKFPDTEEYEKKQQQANKHL